MSWTCGGCMLGVCMRMLDVELSIPGCVYKPTSKWEAPPYAGSRNAVARASKNGPSIFGLDSIVVKVWPEIIHFMWLQHAAIIPVPGLHSVVLVALCTCCFCCLVSQVNPKYIYKYICIILYYIYILLYYIILYYIYIIYIYISKIIQI